MTSLVENKFLTPSSTMMVGKNIDDGFLEISSLLVRPNYGIRKNLLVEPIDIRL